MDKGTRIGWRSSLMAPVCFVIRRRIKGGGGEGETGRARERGQMSRKTAWTRRKGTNKENMERRD